MRIIPNALHGKFVVSPTQHDCPNLSAVFFPVVLYQGTRVSRNVPSPMLHWVILCRFGSVEKETPDLFPSSFLNSCSVRVRNGELQWKAQMGETQFKASSPNPVQWLGDHGQNLLKNLRQA